MEKLKRMKKIFLRLLIATYFCIFFVPPVFAEVQLGAKMLWEHGYYNGVHHQTGDSGSGNAIRLVRVYLKNKFDEHWDSMLQLQISERDGSTKTVWKEAFIKYNGLGPFDLTLGKRKEPFGLQMLVNAERVLLPERAMISSSFAPERSIGLTLSSYPTSKTSVEAGIYNQGDNGNSSFAKSSPDAGNSEKDTYAVTGRFTFTPMQKNNSLVHFGLAASYRDFGGNEYQVKDRAEINLAQPFVTSRKTPADHLTIFGIEAAAQLGPVSLQSEYMQILVSAVDGAEDVEYDGYYVQLGYFLTNGSRDYHKGKFGAVKPLSPFGTWQLMGRYSVLNAENNNEGVEAENITLGLNWFANRSVRISTNYIMTQLNGAKLANDDGDAFLVRFQYVF